MKMKFVNYFNFILDIFYLITFFFILKYKIELSQKKINMLLLSIFIISFIESNFFSFNHNFISGIFFDIFFIFILVKIFFIKSKDKL
jgi:hypothetical protein